MKHQLSAFFENFATKFQQAKSTKKSWLKFQTAVVNAGTCASNRSGRKPKMICIPCLKSQLPQTSRTRPAPLPAVTSQAPQKLLVLDFYLNSAYIICFFGQHAFNCAVSCAIELFYGFTVFPFQSFLFFCLVANELWAKRFGDLEPTESRETRDKFTTLSWVKCWKLSSLASSQHHFSSHINGTDWSWRKHWELKSQCSYQSNTA